jgi:hypothetical protein
MQIQVPRDFFEIVDVAVKQNREVLIPEVSARAAAVRHRAS